MRILALGSLIVAAACSSGCNRQPVSEAAPGGRHGGRYLGIGVYPASDLWSHLAPPNRGTDPHEATLQDDTQLIVVVDSNSGEIRQCGNMSGHCIGMNPWAAALGQGRTAPVALDTHQADLDREAREGAADGEAVNVIDAAAPARSGRR